MIVHFSAHISKWELVCKFGVIFHIFIISCLCSRFNAWNQWFFYSIITFSYTKYFVHSYTVDVVFTLSYLTTVCSRGWSKEWAIIAIAMIQCISEQLWGITCNKHGYWDFYPNKMSTISHCYVSVFWLQSNILSGSFSGNHITYIIQYVWINPGCRECEHMVVNGSIWVRPMTGYGEIMWSHHWDCCNLGWPTRCMQAIVKKVTAA